MTMTQTKAPRTGTSITLAGRLRSEGLTGFWGRLRHRDGEAFEAWLEEQDMIAIADKLARLSERQLNRIGLSRQTLALDIGDLAARTARERQIARDLLRIVSDTQEGQTTAAE